MKVIFKIYHPKKVYNIPAYICSDNYIIEHKEAKLFAKANEMEIYVNCKNKFKDIIIRISSVYDTAVSCFRMAYSRWLITIIKEACKYYSYSPIVLPYNTSDFCAVYLTEFGNYKLPVLSFKLEEIDFKHNAYNMVTSLKFKNISSDYLNFILHVHSSYLIKVRNKTAKLGVVYNFYKLNNNINIQKKIIIKGDCVIVKIADTYAQTIPTSKLILGRYI